jgi:hypothetical protein
MKTIFNTKVENDALSLMTDGQAENAPVERDAEGVLTGFRILKFGPLSVTKGTKAGTVAMSGEFTLEHADVIMGNFAAKGAKNPIDCNHMLYALANKAKVDESEIVKVTGRESLAIIIFPAQSHKKFPTPVVNKSVLPNSHAPLFCQLRGCDPESLSALHRSWSRVCLPTSHHASPKDLSFRALGK